MSERAVGLMSGTSLDGIDAALVEIAGPAQVDLVEFHSRPYTPADRAALLHALSSGSPRELALLNAELGERFAATVRELLASARVRSTDLSFIASHGQTVWHEPARATLQIGDPAVIAERLGVRVVSDFRTRDVSAGGQGAPLVPMADVMLFAHPGHGRALVNLGGMANLTWVPRRGAPEGVVACDTGPGVAIIDAVTRRADPNASFDRDGHRAARGRVVSGVVEHLLGHAFFSAPPPKSTGRELFGEAYAAELTRLVRQENPAATDDDCIATAVELTVRALCLHLDRWLPPPAGHDLLVSGGGVRNPVLLERLRAACGWTVRSFDEEFFSGDAKEAVAFAYLGWRTLAGLHGNIPSATGAAGPRVLGRITPA